MVDNVAMSTDANGTLSVAVQPDARLYLFGSNAVGDQVSETITGLSSNTLVIEVLPDDPNTVVLFASHP